MKSRKPKKLSPAATIGLVSPGSASTPQKIQLAISNLEALGFKVFFGKNAKARTGYLAGTDQDRLDDLHQFFVDDRIDAIWCLRGGYGSPRLLPQLDFPLIRKNPKILIGYSDITALLNGIYQETGLIGFHAPMATSSFTPFVLKHLQAVLMTSAVPPPIAVRSADANTITKGKVQGRLIGGNLSLLAALCGSPYLPKFKDRILFLEDIGEKPYRIDRMLTQLLQSTDLAKAAGIVLGIFEDCATPEGEDSQSLQETFQDRLGGLGIPVMYGFPIGHIADNATIPIGVMAELDTTLGRLTFLEGAVGD